MSKTFKNLNDLFNYVEKQVQSAMENEIADMVKDKMNLSVHKTVYGTYQPKFYRRREDNGGLSDRDNISITPITGGIEVANTTPLDNGRTDLKLGAIVSLGLGKMPFPRPFYENTIYDILASNSFEETLKTGLKIRGINVE